MLVARLEPPRILIEFFVQERRQSKGSQGDLLGLAGRITNHESRIKNRESRMLPACQATEPNHDRLHVCVV